jgi:O-succinylbenzoate synthase
MLADYCPDLRIFSIPLRNKFRGITTREVAIFRGSQGWSEFSPFLEYDDAESVAWMQAALEAANTPWPLLFREKVAINATMPIVDPKEVKGILDRFSGSTSVKVKIDDFEKGALVVEEVLKINSEVKIRLDVNGGWDVSAAISNLLEYHLRFGNVFDYVEQPCNSLSELARVKGEVPIRIAADESIRKNLESNFDQFSKYADIAILKWQPLGGFKAAHKIAEQIGLPVVISSALETGIGISHGLALAASFEGSILPCGLGTVALFEGDICDPPTIASNGFLDVKRRDPVDHAKYLATPERIEFWKQRILRVLKLIEGQAK